MNKVYVAQINWIHGGDHSFDTIVKYNRFYVEEVLARGLVIVLDPLEADVLLFVPTWKHDKECMDEYNTFKNIKDMAFSLEALDGLIRCDINNG